MLNVSNIESFEIANLGNWDFEIACCPKYGKVSNLGCANNQFYQCNMMPVFDVNFVACLLVMET